MDQKIIINKLWSIIETIPGVINFSSLEDYTNVLEIEKADKSIYVSLDNNKCEVKVAVVVDKNVASNNLVKMISEAVRFALKKEKIEMKKILVYIKGAR